MSGRVSRSAVAGTAVAVLVATACTTGGGESAEPGGGPRITVTPAPGRASVPPNTPVRVSVEDGTITDVRIEQAAHEEPAEPGTARPVVAGGGGETDAAAEGDLSEDRTSWVSDWNLRPGASVRVYATAEDGTGRETEVVSQFATAGVDGEHRLELAANLPRTGDVVGVGMPVVVTFDQPVEYKRQVENSMEVTSEEATEGAWNWLDDETAVFRPREYWEPYQRVSVDLRLAGVEAAEGVYGTRDRRIEFEVGRELVATMHVPDHRMRVAVDGEAVRTIPVSNGKGLRRFNTTTSGIHVTMEKYATLVMDSATVGIPKGSPGYYRLDVDWAVRTSNSGEFTHAAPWNLGNLGRANASNGCTNMSVADARWFYERSLMGDLLVTTGTSRELEWDNGWG
uniref:L,D-transpeptidase n=1 Tax=Nocardiopsis lucentensis TaxID=53441 RepID=UPI000592996E